MLRERHGLPAPYSPVNNQTIPLSGHRKTLFDIFQKGILRMNNPVARSKTLDRRIKRWAEVISDCLAIALAAILLSAQNVFHAVRDLVAGAIEMDLRGKTRSQLMALFATPRTAKPAQS